MRIKLSLLAITGLLFSHSSIAQHDWTAEFYEDREIFESGGAGDGICMYITSVVGRLPLLRDVEPNYDDLLQNEVFVEILADSHEQRVVQAANIALEKYGFVRVENNAYELPDSSLCFLKVYRSESPKGVTFIPFFKNPLERCNAVFTARYDPIAFEQVLAEEFAQFGLTGHTEFRRSILLFHPPMRAEVDTCD